MIEFFTYWYLLPVGIIISFIYTSTGISGANFWAPVYLLWLRLEPSIGFWLSLVSMLFGSISGLISHTKQKSIMYDIAKKYLIITIPLAIIGVLVSPYFKEFYLFLIFGIFIITYAIIMCYKTCRPSTKDIEKHEKIHYLFGAIGGFLTGLVSVGLGKLILPQCVQHKKCLTHVEAVGTTLLVVFITSIFAVITRLNSSFVESLIANRTIILSILLYVTPGVLIGGQLGPRLIKNVNLDKMGRYVPAVLMLVGMLMLLRAFF